MKIFSAFNNYNQTMQTPMFKGKMIDAHMHIGPKSGIKTEDLNKFFTQSYDGDTLELSIVSNIDAMGGKTAPADETEANMEMLRVSRESDGKFIPLAVCQPKKGKAKNIEKILIENPDEFKGIKFHPEMESLPVTNKKYVPYLKLAQEHKLPALFHCEIPWVEGKRVDSNGNNIWHLIAKSKRNSEPAQVYQAAKNIPDTPVVMAHFGSGGELVHKEAQKVLMDSILQEDALLYADISWVDYKNPQRPVLIETIKMLQDTPKGDMTHRLVWGTDTPIGDAGEEFEKEIKYTKQAIRDNFETDVAEKLIEDIFYNNAKKLYLTKEWS